MNALAIEQAGRLSSAEIAFAERRMGEPPLSPPDFGDEPDITPEERAEGFAKALAELPDMDFLEPLADDTTMVLLRDYIKQYANGKREVIDLAAIGLLVVDAYDKYTQRAAEEAIERKRAVDRALDEMGFPQIKRR